MTDISALHFPSGLSIERAKKRAKAASKAGEYPNLTQALDAIAYTQLNLPWGKAIAYLSKRSSIQTQRFMTQNDILLVMKSTPNLTHFGFGAYKDHLKPYKEYLKDVEKEKESLTNAIDECNKACQYLQHIVKRKSINRVSSSYGLKHAAEHYIRCLGETKDEYVANGSFLCAAYYMGFDVKQGNNDSPNGFINFSLQSPIIRWRRLSERNPTNPKLLTEFSELEGRLGLQTSNLENRYHF